MLPPTDHPWLQPYPDALLEGIAPNESGPEARLVAMDDGERFFLLGRPLPECCERRVLVLAPGSVRRYEPSEWDDALIVVEAGEIAIEWALGASHRFLRGDMFYLTGLPGGVLRSRGCDAAVLVAVARRAELRGTESVTPSLI